MDVDAMDELMYDTLVRYFKILAHTGYKSYDVVFKILVINFIYEITHTELRYYITNKDIKLMQDLLYQFLGSTCEISFPTNNRPCCICICNGDGNTPEKYTPPVITITDVVLNTKEADNGDLGISSIKVTCDNYDKLQIDEIGGNLQCKVRFESSTGDYIEEDIQVDIRDLKNGELQLSDIFIEFDPEKDSIFKTTLYITDIKGNDIPSNTFESIYTKPVIIEPKVTAISVNPTQFNATGTYSGNVTVTISNATYAKANSLKIYLSTGTILKSGAAVSANNMVAVTFPVTVGTNYTIKASIQDKNGNEIISSGSANVTYMAPPTYYYYGTGDITVTNIATGSKTTNSNISLDLTSTNDVKVFWFAIPTSKTLTVANMVGNLTNWIYNKEEGYEPSVLSISDATVNNTSYKLYKFTYFVPVRYNLLATIR